jgi:hypothetical protein
VRRVLPSLSLAPRTTKRRKYSNQPKPIIHPIQSHPSTQREKLGKKPLSQERKPLCACFVAVLVTWMSFASVTRELRRCALTMLETHIMMSSLIFRLILILMLCLVLPLMLFSHFSHRTNHCSYGFGSRENIFQPRHFGYDPRPHHGDCFPRRPCFPAGGSHTHFEPRHLNSPHFPCRCSHPTGSKGEVLKTIRTSSSHMVKCWIPKIYLTNPCTKPSTFSRPM